jgi:hypothetical protein
MLNVSFIGLPVASFAVNGGTPASRAPAQQPRQIFFSRAFTSASSALIESTYFPASAFPASAFAATARDAGFAAADDLAVEAILS